MEQPIRIWQPEQELSSEAFLEVAIGDVPSFWGSNFEQEPENLGSNLKKIPELNFYIFGLLFCHEPRFLGLTFVSPMAPLHHFEKVTS